MVQVADALDRHHNLGRSEFPGSRRVRFGTCRSASTGFLDQLGREVFAVLHLVSDEGNDRRRYS